MQIIFRGILRLKCFLLMSKPQTPKINMVAYVQFLYPLCLTKPFHSCQINVFDMREKVARGINLSKIHPHTVSEEAQVTFSQPLALVCGRLYSVDCAVNIGTFEQ